MMDIQKAKDEIEKLEKAINSLIWNFEQQTGLTVESVDLRTMNHVGDAKFLASNRIVAIDARLKTEK